jgi:hypothetical protein
MDTDFLGHSARRATPSPPHSDAVPALRRAQAYRPIGRERDRASNRPQPDGTLLKALASAWRWQRMLDDGVYASVSEICDTENVSKS